jgi:hypothetical protein
MQITFEEGQFNAKKFARPASAVALTGAGIAAAVILLITLWGGACPTGTRRAHKKAPERVTPPSLFSD